MFEVRDRSSGRRLSRHADETAARADVASRLAEAGRDPLIALDRLEVWSDADGGAMRQLDAGVALSRWVAFGSETNPAETVTETRPATDDEVAFLKRRQSSLGVELVLYCIGAAVIAFLFATLLGLALGSIGIGAFLGLIAAVFIVASGFAIAWGKRHDLRLEARAGTVTVKRGPFRAVSPIAYTRTGRLRRGGGADADVCYAEFSDSAIQVDMAVGPELIRLGPLMSATVILFPRTGQILEVLGTDGVLHYRHDDFWRTSFRPSDGAEPARRTARQPEADGPVEQP